MDHTTANLQTTLSAGSEGTQPSAPLFLTDRTIDEVATGQSVALGHIAELIAHRSAQTPMTVGLFGAPGAGKTHAANRIAARVTALGAAASPSGPFVQRILSANLDASALVSEPAAGLARAIHTALAHGTPAADYAALARDAVHAAADPHVAARDANEQLDEARRRLDEERRTMDDLNGRRARLSETVLYDSAGSRIDAYARRHRGQIDARLRGFGFTGEPIASYKDLVRDLADHPGVGARVAAFLRSLWAFAGQTRLVVWAIVFFLLAWGLGVADQTRPGWLSALRGASDNTVAPADWIEAHASWFQSLRQGAVFAALLCLVANVSRAVRFMIPLMQGARLLDADVATRRIDLDDLLTHQSRRIDMLVAEVDARARRAQEAEHRASASQSTGGAHDSELPFDAGEPAPHKLAEDYLDAVQRGLRAPNAPQRMVLIVDGFSALHAEAAATLVDQLHRLLDRPGFVSVLAIDPRQLSIGWGSTAEAAARIERYVQTPFSIRPLDAREVEAYAQALLGDAGPANEPVSDPSHCVFDAPVSAEERGLLAALTALAGDTPRAVKRFINIYRLARPRASDPAALALMIALDTGGTTGELAAMGAAMDLHEPAGTLVIHPGEPRLVAALETVNGARATPLTIAQAHAAWGIARDYRTPTA